MTDQPAVAADLDALLKESERLTNRFQLYTTASAIELLPHIERLSAALRAASADAGLRSVLKEMRDAFWSTQLIMTDAEARKLVREICEKADAALGAKP